MGSNRGSRLQVAGSPPGQEGFTLLELIIAFTILALMAAVVFSSFRLALNSYGKSQGHLEEQARHRVLRDQIRRQIGSLFPVRPSGSFLETEEEEQAQNLQNPAGRFSQFPLFYGTADAVTFVTIAPLMIHRNPGLTVVHYGLAQDDQGDTFLGALENRYLGMQSFLDMASYPAGDPVPLIEGITELQFEYYGYDAQAQEYLWTTEWLGQERSAVPEAIRIRHDDDQIMVASNAVFFGARRLGRGVQRRITR